MMLNIHIFILLNSILIFYIYRKRNKNIGHGLKLLKILKFNQKIHFHHSNLIQKKKESKLNIINEIKYINIYIKIYI